MNKKSLNNQNLFNYKTKKLKSRNKLFRNNKRIKKYLKIFKIKIKCMKKKILNLKIKFNKIIKEYQSI